MGEVAPHLSLIVHGDRLAVQNAVDKAPHGHVGPAPAPIDGEEAQSGERNAEQMGVGFAHQFVGLLGRGIERDRVIDPVADAEGQVPIGAIDRGGGGIDHLPHAPVSRDFEHVEMPGQV